MRVPFRLFFCFLCFLLAGGSALGQNLALSQPALASSARQAAANAFDGNGNTRWESNFSDPQYLIVDLGSVQAIDRIRLTWENAYGKNFTLDVSTVTAAPTDAAWTNVVNGTWQNAVTTTNNATTVNEYANLGRSGRYVRLLGTARATTYGYSVYEFEVFNYSNNEANNLAFNKQATASTTQGGFPAAQAFDNSSTTRWGSNYADNQWIYVDLNGYASITRVYLVWETAYGKDFRIEVSNDATNWTAVNATTGNSLYYNDISFSPAVSGRYVRMFGVTRGTGYGFSLYEFQVYGSMAAPLPVTLTSFSAGAQPAGVALNWTTASELHNVGYEVQRSANGRDFAKLAFVAGAGDAQTARSYSYFDAGSLATTAYYRLKQVDRSGASAYSPTVVVQAAAARPQVRLYPNPASGSATLAWQAATAHAGRWYLTNSLGQLVHTEPLQGEAGDNTRTLDLSPYTPGMYQLTLETAGQAPQCTRLQISQ